MQGGPDVNGKRGLQAADHSDLRKDSLLRGDLAHDSAYPQHADSSDTPRVVDAVMAPTLRNPQPPTPHGAGANLSALPTPPVATRRRPPLQPRKEVPLPAQH